MSTDQKAQVNDRIHHIDHSFGVIIEVIDYLPNAYYAKFDDGTEMIVFDGDFHNCTKTGKF